MTYYGRIALEVNASTSHAAASVIRSCFSRVFGAALFSSRTTTSTSTSTDESLPALVASTKSGIIRIQATGCGSQDIGTGFLIGPRLVATVEHVVSGATSISLVRDGKTLGSGTVIGYDAVRDVALSTPVEI